MRPAQALDYQLADVPSRAPKRPRLEDVEDGTETGSSRSVTPPNASQRPRCEGGLSSPPVTPMKKRNADDGSNSQWQKMQNDQNYFRADLQSGTLDPAGVSSLVEGSSSPTEPNAESISLLLDGLSNVPAYVSKLERRNLAANKSNEAKAKRIIQLEDEIQKLKAKNRALQDAIKALT